MKFKLINQKTKEIIGEINLQFLPKVNDIIEFKNEEYTLSSIIHSESEIKLRVSEPKKNKPLTMAEPTVF
tara:strand:+ start:2792 stop:3001 length:210 start_codon:yes stop_codon:yes gene_type:complete